MSVETILTNARVLTMRDEGEQRSPQAIAMDAGRIFALGSVTELAPLADSGTRVLDLGGRTVLPGFIDSHVHFTQTGLGSLGPHVYGLRTRAAVLESIAAAVHAAGPDVPLLVHGCSFTDLDTPVSRADLDRIAPAAPLMLGDVGAHACVVNSAAGRLIGLELLPTADEPLRGSANTQARYQFYSQVIDDDMRRRALQRASQMALEVGITTVHALEGGSADGRGWLPQRDVEILLREQSGLPCRTVVYFQSTDVAQTQLWQLPRIGGCLWVDGSYFEHTAALLEPYADHVGGCGCLYFSQSDLDAFVLRAHCAGMQLSLHAIGDAAIEQVINAYERALKRAPRRDHRHRIEHFSLPTPTQIDRVAELGIAVAMQPNFAQHPLRDAAGERLPAPLEALLGEERYRRRHPYRRILDAGVLVAGGSDADPKPMGPLIGVEMLASHPEQQRRLSVLEALTLYTVNGAKIAFEEADKGTIAPGKLADLVVLNRDPLLEPPASLSQISVDLTVVAGCVMHRRAGVELPASALPAASAHH